MAKTALGLTSKMDSFALDVAAGKSQVQAYYDHYDCANMKYAVACVKASQLAKHPLIMKRIEDIRAKSERKALMTIEKHLDDLLALRNRAAQMGQIGTAVAAEVARGKAFGIAVDRSELTVKHQGLPSSVDDFV